MLLLEQERGKYAELEAEYKRFARDSLRERENLVKDIRSIRERADDEVNRFQNILNSKQTEFKKYSEKVTGHAKRLEEAIGSLKQDREKLINECQKLKEAIKDGLKKSLEQESVSERLVEENRQLHTRFLSTQDEIGSLKRLINEKEAIVSNEKEFKMKQEVKLFELEHGIAKREDECKELRAQSQKKDIALQAAADLKIHTEQQKRLIAELRHKEKRFIARLKELETTERSRNEQIANLEGQERRYLSELQRLTQQETLLTREHDMVKIRVADLEERNQNLTEKNQSQAFDIEKLSVALDKAVNDVNQYQKLHEVTQNELMMTENKFHAFLDDQKQYENDSQNSIRSLQSEIDRITDENKRYDARLERANDELQYANTHSNNMENRIKELQHSELELRQRLKDNIKELEVSKARNASLKMSLKEADSSHRQIQDQLKATLHQKDESEKSKDRRIRSLGEMNSKLKNANEEYAVALGQLQNRDTEFEQVLISKSKELNGAVSDIEYLKSQLDAMVSERDDVLAKMKDDRQCNREELSSLRQDYEEKIAMIEHDRDRKLENMLEQMQELESQINEIDEHRKELLKKTDHRHLERQIYIMEQEIRQRDDEVKLMQLKYRNATEQVKRLEQDQQHIQKSSVNNLRIENVTGLTKRLKNEVREMMLRDKERQNDRSLYGSNGGATITYEDGDDDFSSIDQKLASLEKF